MRRFPKGESVDELPLPRPGRRDSAWLMAIEVAVIVALFVADYKHHVYLSKTPFLFLLGWISLRWRGLGWSDVGLSRPANWRRTLVIGIVCGIGMGALEVFFTEPVLIRLTGKVPDLSALGALQGNWKMMLLLIAGMWPLAAFGEEMVYRGYLMNRVAGRFGNPRVAWTISLVTISILFGTAHIDQGITGQVENMVNGLLLGVIFLASGCNLWAAIITHGVTDTIGIVLLFLGKYPGA